MRSSLLPDRRDDWSRHDQPGQLWVKSVAELAGTGMLEQEITLFIRDIASVALTHAKDYATAAAN